MPISFVAAGTVATGANPTVTVPTGYALDDFLIIVTVGTATTSTPTGWTQISAQGAGQFLTTFYKFSAASESSVALTNAGTSTSAVMLAYRGVGLQDVISAYTTATATTLATATQTTLLANDYVISIYGNVAGGARTWTAPGSTTSRVNSSTTTTITGMLVVDELKATAGLTTARTATISASSALSAVSISIREPQTLYWRGAGGTWNTTTKTNWSLTSGGAGSVAVPNQLDNVIFDVNSNTGTTAWTVTLSGARCNNLNLSTTSPIDAQLTFAGGTSSLFIYGNMNLDDGTGLQIWTGTPTITFGATTTGKTIGWGPNSYSGGSIVFDGIGGEWSSTSNCFADACTLTLTNGTLTLSSTYSISVRSFASSNSNTRAITFPAGSTMNLSPTGTITALNFTTITNLTITGTPDFFIVAATNGTATTVQSNSSFTESNAPNITYYAWGGSLTINGNVRDLTIGISTAVAFTVANTAITIFGNFANLDSSVTTYTAGTNTWTFAATSSKTITSSGETFDFPITFNGVGGTWALQDAMTVGSTRTVTLTNGTLNLNNNNLTTGLFVSSNSNTRTIAFGTGQFFLTGNNAAIWNTDTSTNLTVTGTNPTVNSTYSGATGARSIIMANTAGGSEANAINVNFTAGTDTAQPYGFGLKSVNFTGFSGSWGTIGTKGMYGGVTLSSTMTVASTTNEWRFLSTSGTYDITTNGLTVDNPISFNGIGGTWRLQGALTLGSTRSAILNNGTLNLNNFNLTTGIFNSNNSNTRAIAFGTGQIFLTNNATTVLAMGTVTGYSYTGTAVFNATYSGATGTRVISFGGSGGNETNAASINVTAGTDAIDLAAGANYDNLNFTGFSGTLNNFAVTVFGNYTISTGMTLAAGVNTTTFGGTSGTSLLTTNGKTLDFPVTFNGVGGTWQLQDNMTVGSTRTVTLTNGTLNLSNNNLTCGAFNTNTATTRTLAFSASGLITINGTTNSIGWQAALGTLTVTGTNPTVNFNIGTSAVTKNIVNGIASLNISFNILSGTDGLLFSTNFYCNNLNYTGYAGTVTVSGTGSLFIYGSLTISTGMTLYSGTVPTVFSATSGINDITTAGKTFDFPVTFSGVGGTFRLLDAMTVGSTRTVTLTNGTLNLNNFNLTCGIFQGTGTTARTLAFGTGQIFLTNSSTTIWSTNDSTNLTVSGTNPTMNVTTAATTGTRTLVIANTAGGSEAIAINVNVTAGTDTIQCYGAAIKSLDFTGFSGSFGGTGNKIFYGGLTLSSTTTVVFGGTYTFAATSGTYDITSNGVSIDNQITFNGVGGTWRLQGALTVGSARTAILTNGTLNLNNNNLTCGLFQSNNSNTRTLAFGTGQIYITGNNATILNMNNNTNCTFTGSRVFNATYSGSVGTRTCANGAAGGGSETSAVTLNITAGSDLLNIGNPFYARSYDFTGFSGTLGTALVNYFVFGDITFSSTMSLFAGSPWFIFPANSTANVTLNGITINADIGCGATSPATPNCVVNFVDALTLASTRTLNLRGGTVNLAAGATSTVGAFTTSGTALKYLRSTISGTQATLSGASGTNAVTYLDIKDSNATGGATFDATSATNVNSGNNTGWNFGTVIYNDSITENLSVADIQSVIAQFASSITEAMTLADTESAQASFNSAITEALNPADIQAVTAVFASAISENSTLADISTTANILTSSISEAATLGDVSSVAAIFASSIAENAGLADTESALSVFSRSVTETLTPADVQAVTAVFASAIAEATTLADITNRVAVFASAIAEASTVADISSVTANFNSSITENTTENHTQVAQVNFNSSATENSNLADSTNSVLVFSVSIAEPLTSAEAENATLVITRSITEAITAADVESALATFNVTRVEPVTSADTQSVSAIFAVSRTENSTLADIQTAVQVLLSSIVEGLTAADTVASIKVMSASNTEASTLLEIQTASASFSVARVEPSTMADVESALKALYADSTENANLADTESARATFNSSATEPITTAETESARATFNSTTTEPTTLADSSAALRTLVSVITEILTSADTTAATSIFAASISEDLTPADIATAQANFSAFLAENMLILDTPIGRGWFRVVDSQTVVWNAVNNGHTVTWQNIGNDQNPNWVVINNTQE